MLKDAPAACLPASRASDEQGSCPTAGCRRRRFVKNPQEPSPLTGGPDGVHQDVGDWSVNRRHVDRLGLRGKGTAQVAPSTDPQFPKFQCAGTLTISNVDVTFTAGTSPGCASSMHQRTAGTLSYSELREIRVTARPELLIFSTDAEPPRLRVTDWIGGPDFHRAVTDLENAYQRWRVQKERASKLP